jgi:hypothetical protein
MRYVSDDWGRRIEEAFRRNTEAFERNAEAFDRNTEAFDEWKAERQDMREFMREITQRVERSGRAEVRALDTLTEEIRAMRQEWVAEMRAQRGALLAILDRLSPGGSGSAA